MEEGKKEEASRIESRGVMMMKGEKAESRRMIGVQMRST